ncbi:general secretion pathway protein K [bacterium BMS3Bbin06]|nr:general secretion pathway protein K [bacterium BMS3Bbin06]HDY71019.1 hypothetical protein [Nitrospirota bacterium]
MRREINFRFKQQDGVALLLVLWVLILLMVLGMSFSYMTRTELEAGHYFNRRLKDDMLLEGAIQRAVLELLHARKSPDAEDIWDLNGGLNLLKEDNSEMEIRIIPESSKVDLNRASDVILKGLLAAIGVDAETQDVIADSLLDWRDPDDLHRLNGAENDYYHSLDRPYDCKNGNLDSTEELLLVRGVTREIFYGNGEKPGLRDYVTVFSDSDRININTAAREVLLSLPGMDEDTADAVIEYRKNKQIKNSAELQDALGGLYAGISGYVTFSAGNTYRVIARRKGKAFGIEATIQINGNDFTIRKWKETVKQIEKKHEES